MKVFTGLIYKAKRGLIYDSTNKQFDCYMPAFSGDFHIVDCWVCDQFGEIHPGYSNSACPVCISSLGEVVNKIELF